MFLIFRRLHSQIKDETLKLKDEITQPSSFPKKGGRIMQELSVLVMALSLCLSFALNFHIIRTREGFRIIRKFRMNFRKPYMDIRSWRLRDYLTHSRIRSYLMYEKPMARITAKLRRRNGRHTVKGKLRKLENSAHRWMSGKLR